MGAQQSAQDDHHSQEVAKENVALRREIEHLHDALREAEPIKRWIGYAATRGSSEDKVARMRHKCS